MLGWQRRNVSTPTLFAPVNLHAHCAQDLMVQLTHVIFACVLLAVYPLMDETYSKVPRTGSSWLDDSSDCRSGNMVNGSESRIISHRLSRYQSPFVEKLSHLESEMRGRGIGLLTSMCQDDRNARKDLISNSKRSLLQFDDRYVYFCEVLRALTTTLGGWTHT